MVRSLKRPILRMLVMVLALIALVGGPDQGEAQEQCQLTAYCDWICSWSEITTPRNYTKWTCCRYEDGHLFCQTKWVNPNGCCDW